VPTTINPVDGRVLAEYAHFDVTRTEAALVQAHTRQREWAAIGVERRATLLHALGQGLRARLDECAGLIADEMGKPLAQGRAEIEKCAWLCEYIAEHGPAMLVDEPADTDALRSYASPQPLGVILAIMPWNFPFWQVVRAGVPALLAGNAIVLKHAEATLGCALLLETIVREAGVPEGVLGNLIVDHAATAAVISDPRIAGVTLTGSVRAGRTVAALAGRALKKVVLELGGSDPYVVLADADLELAAKVCVRARLTNGGQSCVAAKRFIVVESVATTFTQLVIDELQAAKVGDPRDPDTTVGPMARVDLRDELHSQVERSVAAGAKLRLGGQVPAGPGAFYPVTLLDEVRPGMPAADEELFGPVAAILHATDEAHAIEIANASEFGLGAVVFTRDLARGEAIARDRFAAGCCFVNEQVRSDPRLPFGGIKASGHGRELGRAGLYEWVNLKTVWVGS
jgi:succinate-semialdehyde dehydrogenase/glutarate-semialdehyde dehydrogenase